MPVELIWIAGVVAIASFIIGSALYSEVTAQFRRVLPEDAVGRRQQLAIERLLFEVKAFAVA